MDFHWLNKSELKTDGNIKSKTLWRNYYGWEME